jgi:CelD/BcsL family acetyltransferase involved in cellulose biosynthesis
MTAQGLLPLLAVEDPDDLGTGVFPVPVDEVGMVDDFDLAAAAATERLVLKPAELAQAFDDVLAVERASWKEAAATSFTARPAVAEFFKTFGRQAAERGWLRLRLLYLDGRPAAYVFALVRKGEFLTLKTSYDEERKSLSPGAVLFESVAREAFREGGKTFDIMGVEARWKNEYAEIKKPRAKARSLNPVA